MPYVKETLRDILDPKINDLLVEIKKLAKESNGKKTSGVANYVITRLLVGIYGTDERSYDLFNSAVGVLGCVLLELYRRMIAPYEDIKQKENGDVYPTW